MRTSTRLDRISTPILVLITIGALVQWTAASEPTPLATEEEAQAEPSPEAVEEAVPEGKVSRSERQLQSMWWHGPKIGSALELSDEQVKRMDEIFRRVNAERTAETPTFQELSPLLMAAAQEGDGDTVASLLDEAIELRRRASGTDLRVAKEVLSVLDAGQLRILAEQFPVVLERPWTLRLGGDRKDRADRRERRARPRRTPLPDTTAPQED